MTRSCWLVALLMITLCPGLRASEGSGRVKALAERGRWFEARELGERLLKKNPEDRAVRSQLSALDRKARLAALNLDFNPERYFYAQAYQDYFNKRRYARALDSMEEVLAMDQGNKELMSFKEKVGPLAEKELLARGLPIGPQAEDLVQSGRSVGLPEKPLPPAEGPADFDRSETVYRDALKAYVRKDLPRAQDLLRGLLAREPDNERWRKSLQRIEKELPQTE